MDPFALLEQARLHAQQAGFTQMRALCRECLEGSGGDSFELLLQVGGLLLHFGFLSEAGQCYVRARELAPQDLRPLVNLANVAREAGDHAQARKLYDFLEQRLPDNALVRRNALTSLEYDPACDSGQRRQRAAAWGAWATARAEIESGGPVPRPARNALTLAPGAGSLPSRPLRVGYVSADMCQHTVGLFALPVLKAHEPQRVLPFIYSSGQVQDWLSEELRAACAWRHVTNVNDVALAAAIREDNIDVLVDLSGHTGGSRLTAFALRPAPVMVSWLGYFATTGLPCMDGVLLDQWHVPPGSEAYFTEPVWRLPQGRWCYQPPPWAPAMVAAPPCVERGYITFGCYNNTAKLNADVLDVWARLLAAVPDARLLLKWRTFNDEHLCHALSEAFGQRGIAPARLELRGPSFHADLLNEYADVDIALDPFPFTGGLTSCEALWMGVPVVTLPQESAVSRQTLAVLSAIGLPHLAADSPHEYISIAQQLAQDRAGLAALRRSLRQRMADSPLMDVPAFTRGLEDTLLAVFLRQDRETTGLPTLLV